MNTARKFIFVAALLVTGSGLCFAQSSSPVNASSSTSTTTTSGGSTAPYTEGTVWQITMVRTKPGMTESVTVSPIESRTCPTGRA